MVELNIGLVDRDMIKNLELETRLIWFFLHLKVHSVIQLFPHGAI